MSGTATVTAKKLEDFTSVSMSVNEAQHGSRERLAGTVSKSCIHKKTLKTVSGNNATLQRNKFG
eukprot:5414599-Amphidinium_carterae.2